MASTLRTLTGLFVASFTMLLVFGILSVNSASANFVGFYMPKQPPPTPTSTVSSPLKFDAADPEGILHVAVKFTVHVDTWISDYGYAGFGDYEAAHVYEPTCSLKVLVDGKVYAEPDWINDNQISVSLIGLSDGLHSVEVVTTVTGHYSDQGEQVGVKKATSGIMSVSILPLEVSLLTPTDQTLNSTSVQLNFSVSRRPIWLGYSLDYKDNVTVNEDAALTSTFQKCYYNMALSGLSEGAHYMTIYAKDAAGKTAATPPFTLNVKGQDQMPETTTPTPSASLSMPPSSPTSETLPSPSNIPLPLESQPSLSTFSPNPTISSSATPFSEGDSASPAIMIECVGVAVIAVLSAASALILRTHADKEQHI